MERKYIKEIFKDKKEERVLVRGWVHDQRDLGKIKFMLIKDITGLIQVTAIKGKVDDIILKEINKIPKESVVEIIGDIKKNKKAPGGFEIFPEKLIIISKAEQPLPIDVSDFSKTELPKRLDYRFLDFHNRKVQAIFKIQTEIANSFRKYFYDRGFIEIQSPCIISSASEGGTELFEIKYFEKKAYLAQSPQLYKQMVACSMEKTFAITPVFRAEKHNTPRHINEIRQMDIEMAFADQFKVMKELENVMKFIVKNVKEKCKDELNLLGVKLKDPRGVYLSYDEAIKKVNGIKGDDFTPEEEKKLCDLYKGDVVFVHSWPVSLKPFYIMPKNEDKNAEYSEGFDALYGGFEIASGGQRIHIPELLIEMIKKKGLDPKNFKDYIESFKYGAPPHGGWAIGLERLTQAICGLSNIKEATMFPRDRTRLKP